MFDDVEVQDRCSIRARAARRNRRLYRRCVGRPPDGVDGGSATRVITAIIALPSSIPALDRQQREDFRLPGVTRSSSFVAPVAPQTTAGDVRPPGQSARKQPFNPTAVRADSSGRAVSHSAAGTGPLHRIAVPKNGETEGASRTCAQSCRAGLRHV